MTRLNSVPKFVWLAPLALFALAPHAQQSKTRTGIVNVQTVVAAMPSGAGFVALSKKADVDIQAQTTVLQKLQAKASGSTATAADKNAYTAAAKKYQASADSYQKQLATLFAPLASQVNKAVAAVAKASGYSVVLDQRTARDRGLILYANSQATDLTAAVTAKIKSGK